VQTITINYPNSQFLFSPNLWFQNFDEYFQDFHNISPFTSFFSILFVARGENLQKGIAGLIPQNPNLLGI
jgi:hypothetical protein